MALNLTVVFISGCLFFPSVFFLCKTLLVRLFGQKLTTADIYHISVKYVSSLQAVMSCIVGYNIVNSCNDLIHDQYWLTNIYACFALPYFGYDLWAMKTAHKYQHSHILLYSNSKQWRHFVVHNKLMTFHHLVLPAVIYPVLLFFRNGKGDYLVGCFYLFEMAVPFVSARSILVQLKMKNTVLYLVTSLLMVAVFILSRILIFPFLFWSYAGYMHTSVWLAAQSVPLKCKVGCLLLLAPQLYWITLMFQGTYRTFSNMFTHKPLQ